MNGTLLVIDCAACIVISYELADRFNLLDIQCLWSISHLQRASFLFPICSVLYSFVKSRLILLQLSV